MSEKEMFRRVWIAVFSGIILTVLTSVGAIVVQGMVSSKILEHASEENSKDISELKTQQEKFATKNEVDKSILQLSKETNENKEGIKSLNEKVDRHYENIMSGINDLRN